jgi:sigma-E factor negative regulatory protein RseC
MDEIGIVEKILPGGEAVVIVERSSACAGCEMSGICFSDGRKILRVKVKPDFPCHEGQRVRLDLDAANFVKYSFITYIIPVLLLMFGAGISESLFTAPGGHQYFTIAGGFIGLALGMLFVRFYSRRLERKDKVVVKVINAEG